MMGLVAMLAGNWRPLMIVAALGALALGGALLVHQRNAARKQAAGCAAQLAIAQAAERECEAAVAHQNAAVEQLSAAARQAADAARTRQENLAAAAESSGAAAEVRARALVGAAVAPGCDAAIKWGNAQARELGRW
jgi:IS5 family transposase